MTKLLEPLIASPALPRYVQELREVLARRHTLRQKFHEEMSEQQKAEFINGQVILHSTVQRQHSLASDFLFKLISTYVDQNDLGWVGHEKLLVSLMRNDYQPDVAFWNAARVGVRAGPDEVPRAGFCGRSSLPFDREERSRRQVGG